MTETALNGTIGKGHETQPRDDFKEKRDELFRLHAPDIYRIRELGAALDIIWQSIELETDPIKFETGVAAVAFLADEIDTLAADIERDLRPIANKRYSIEGP